MSTAFNDHELIYSLANLLRWFWRNGMHLERTPYFVFKNIDGLEMDYENWEYAFAFQEGSEDDQLTDMGKQYYLD